ncbi:Calpain catalytic domain-containing protein [Caenorhabditis elegans]|uniref:Calpain catalytic domain-containing protein n=2 Tax=Caenorhabditis elegans TaxID=6239 RepID=A0A131MD14_CAEEL|nr:Calpain catalytic domain-containing protein [Caenorhabditis elegans]CZR14479.1 Calpain catalytic domain-containing protein [Caenorhabditis elegans]|eukprot:NP_001309563.1 CaLPain Related [Caenorhabditis elegans]
MKHGIAQIRLLINGEWKVIKIDFHVPSSSASYEIFTPMVRKQAWAALIQKAFAKLGGSYAKLHGGFADIAFLQLTGSFTSTYYLNKLSSDNDIWDFILSMQKSKFLVTACSTYCEEGSEEWDIFLKNQISPNHGYSILDTKIHEGHRLVLIGNFTYSLPDQGTGTLKWGHLPRFDEKCLCGNIFDYVLSTTSIHWVDLHILSRFFSCFEICHYREGWKEIRFRKTLVPKNGKTEILKLFLKTRCELVIEVIRRKEALRLEAEQLRNRCILFCIVYSATADNKCDKILMITHAYDLNLELTPGTLDPGTYLISFVILEDYDELELDWVIRSPSDMSYMTFDFISHPIESQLDDIQQFIIEEGEIIKSDTGELTVYKLGGRYSNVFVYENNCRFNFISVEGSLSNSLHNNYLTATNGLIDSSFEIPPQSRVILEVVSCEWEYFSANFNIEFKVLPFMWTVCYWFAPLVEYFVPESSFNYSFQTPVVIKKRQDHRWTIEEKTKKD